MRLDILGTSSTAAIQAAAIQAAAVRDMGAADARYYGLLEASGPPVLSRVAQLRFGERQRLLPGSGVPRACLSGSSPGWKIPSACRLLPAIK
jgi:hypothetical protein